MSQHVVNDKRHAVALFLIIVINCLCNELFVLDTALFPSPLCTKQHYVLGVWGRTG